MSRRWGTVEDACRLIGGETKPVSPATFYRGVRGGRYRGPVHPSPGISRVDLDGLAEDIERQVAANAGDNEAGR